MRKAFAHTEVERINCIPNMEILTFLWRIKSGRPLQRKFSSFTPAFLLIVRLSVQSSLIEELAAGYSQIWLLEAGTRSGRGRNVRQSPLAVRRGQEMRLQRLCL